MFMLHGKEAKAEIREQIELDSVIFELEKKGFIPVLRNMLRSACESVKIEPNSLPIDALISDPRFRHRPLTEDSPIGDVFHLDDHLFLLHPQRNRLVLWEVRHHSQTSMLDDSLIHLESAIKACLDGRRVRGMSFDWKEAKTLSRRRVIRSRRFHEMKLETKAPEYIEEQKEQAKLLVNGKLRDFVISLSQVGKARTRDAEMISNSEITQPLLEKQLIRKEYLVTCKQDSRTLCSVPDKNHLDSDAASSMRCPTCGRFFKEELIQEIFALTDAARNLIKGSQWMTIWVTNLLCIAGIHKDKIKWNATAGDDELDIVSEIQGLNVFFELKDREFGLGDAYPFGFRLERYGGDIGVVVTMDKIATEAKKFFEEQSGSRASRIECLEGCSAIQEALPALIEDISCNAVERFFWEFTSELGLDLLPLVRKWLKKNR